MSESSTGNFTGDHISQVWSAKRLNSPTGQMASSINKSVPSVTDNQITYFTATYEGNLDTSRGRTTLRDGASRPILMRQGRV